MNDLDENKQKQLYDFLSSGFQTPSGPSRPPAANGLPPVPPSDLQETEKPTESDSEISAKTIDSHPGVQQNDLDNYIKNQESEVDRFGPQKQAETMQNLEKGYRSPLNAISKGGATIADAIMQGVARAGSGGNLAAIDAREQANLNRAAEMVKSLNQQNLEGLREKQALESLSSRTPLGASQTPMLSAVLEKMGYSPDKIKGMLTNPSAAKSALAPMADIFSAQMKAQLEAELKKIELGMQAQNLASTHEERSAQQALENEKFQADVAKALESRGVWRRVTDKLTGNPATKVLESQLETSGPLGEYTKRDGKTYKWSSTTKKYHKVKVND